MVKLGFFCNNGIRNLFNSTPTLRTFPLLYSTSTSTSSIDYGGKLHSPSISDFLVNSLGFRKKQSTSVSAKLAKLRRPMGGTKKVSDFNFADNAHSVVDYFKQLGFKQSQIKRLVSQEPCILLSSVEISLKPKINALKELGVSDYIAVDLISMNHELLSANLELVNDAFRSVEASDDDVVRSFRRPMSIGCLSNFVHNVLLLKDTYGVSDDNIRKRSRWRPEILFLDTVLFREILVKVEEKLGIPRDSSMFLYGVQVLFYQDEKSLEKKCDVFKSFGWTQSHVTAFIRRNPFCLVSSELAIKQKLDFLMNRVGYTPDYLVTRVSLFTCSLEKRLLPRHQVLQILWEKGKTNCSFCSTSYLTDSAFIKRFVLPFEEVHELYARLTGSTVDLFDVGIAKGAA